MMTVERQQELIIINKVLAVLVVVLAFTSGLFLAERLDSVEAESGEAVQQTKAMALPTFGGIVVSAPKNSPVSNALKQARYGWEINPGPVSKEALLALVWAGQGQITEWGERTAPSYKSRFPAALSVLVNNVDGIEPGYYVFDAINQELVPQTDSYVSIPNDKAAAVLMLSGMPENTTSQHMVWHEAGAIAQNILLMSQELSLASLFSPSEMNSQSQELWKISIGKGTQ
jgi:hypothetical protein